MTDDPRLAAARYRQKQLAGGGDGDDAPADDERARAANAVDRAAYVEVSIQQAMRRGDFDNLPGAGKPIPDLGSSHDADWWIRRKIQTEQLTGLGPPALMLRVENAELEDRLDELGHEDDVREALEDFNGRVIDARRQLLGGPPVVTPTRDVDAEVAAWARRRAQRAAATPPETDASPRRRWWRRR
ncbi:MULTISPECIES: DUF1992 domain-containing protein [Microbacterium]|uniref:DnaJ family domain-containing protein n=1 Tax=Microbacterium TaxID=33882 RepID=UPI001469D92C|nr:MULTISPECIES: DUF1992 domain-containing protein [Microbacterium]